MAQPRYSMEVHARQGKDWYERVIRPKVAAGNHGRIVAIDIETGEYELGDTVLTAAKALLSRLPEAQPWCERIGYPGVHFYGHSVREDRS